MTGSTPKLNPAAARKLGWYVYLYVDPRDDDVFYVGKGKGARMVSHLRSAKRSGSRGKRRGGGEERATTTRICEIWASKQEPRIEVLAHGLSSEQEAFRVESAAIDLLGIDNLTNAVGGHQARVKGRMVLGQALAHYTRKPAIIREPVILIRINKLYHPTMTPTELYDATRSAWKVGWRAEEAEYAAAVFEGVVRELYAITGWHEGGTTFNYRWGGMESPRDGRKEFVGTIAPEEIRRRYLNRYVGDLFVQGSQNPITYADRGHGRRRQ